MDIEIFHDEHSPADRRANFSAYEGIIIPRKQLKEFIQFVKDNCTCNATLNNRKLDELIAQMEAALAESGCVLDARRVLELDDE